MRVSRVHGGCVRKIPGPSQILSTTQRGKTKILSSGDDVSSWTGVTSTKYPELSLSTTTVRVDGVARYGSGLSVVGARTR